MGCVAVTSTQAAISILAVARYASKGVVLGPLQGTFLPMLLEAMCFFEFASMDRCGLLPAVVTTTMRSVAVDMPPVALLPAVVPLVQAVVLAVALLPAVVPAVVPAVAMLPAVVPAVCLLAMLVTLAVAMFAVAMLPVAMPAVLLVAM